MVVSETIRNLCISCELVAVCQAYLEMLKQDNERQLAQFYPRIFTVTVVYQCEYYKGKEKNENY